MANINVTIDDKVKNTDSLIEDLLKWFFFNLFDKNIEFYKKRD